MLILLYDRPSDSRLFDMAQQIVKGGHACLQVVYFRAATVSESFTGLEDAGTALTIEQDTESVAEATVTSIRESL